MGGKINQRDLLTHQSKPLFTAIAFYEAAAQQLSLWIIQIHIFPYLGMRLANFEAGEESG